MQGSRDGLFVHIRGLGEEQFRHASPNEPWSIATHLAHLLRVERLFVARARMALDQEDPEIPSTNGVNEDDVGLAQRLAVPQIVHGLQAARRELDELLAGCTEAHLTRAIVHERRGRMTVADIAAKMAAHEAEHSFDVARLARHAPRSGRVTIPVSGRS